MSILTCADNGRLPIYNRVSKIGEPLLTKKRFTDLTTLKTNECVTMDPECEPRWWRNR